MIWGFYEIWGNFIRYIGVGAMVVGGLWTIFTLRSNLASGIKEAIAGLRGGQVDAKKRTDQDLNFKWVFLAIGALTIPIFLLYAWISNEWAISGIGAQKPTTQTIGTLLMTDYLLPFEVASLLLLGALVGAALLARKGE